MGYLTVWILTVIIEFIIIWILVKDNPWLLLLYSVIINSLTLPIATYSYINLLPNIYLVEITVIIIESILLMFLLKIKYPKALMISAAANTVTAFIGYLMSI
ncbi:hypothetical protein [Methanobacterium spitsbergense]|uniref:Uncharacterized protein n=1 Tax=Methanobacterium spitsbergense TaxID=2874285 RepID=A0A8T5V1G0_9EURY|nr:hypothetical protein [Methanobacterium spitsbergense]MBZ2166799.1 hypothetical protein [Methanobacterium spitsbergense]